MVFAGAKCAAAPVTVEAQSSQYVPGANTVFTVAVLRHIFRVVPGATPGAGTAELEMRK